MRTLLLAPCFIGVALGVSSCAWAERATLDAVAPELRAKGQRLQRAQDAEGFQLGTYHVSKPTLSREHADPNGLLARTDAPRPVVQHRLDLGLDDSASGRKWSIRCTSQRRQPGSMDYASVLEENRDEIAVECDVGIDEKQGWHFVTEAELSHNFAGVITQASTDRSLTVEVIMWVERFGRIKRHLPDPVAQVRSGDKTVAAMVLARPEQAWLAAELDPELAEVAISTMLALRFLPLGLEE